MNAFLVVFTVLAQLPAGNPQAKATAQGLLREGAAHYQKGEYTEALDKFNAAYAAFPSPKLHFNIGQANRDLGRPVDALEAFEKFLSQAPDAAPDTLSEARASVAELGKKLGRLRVECPTPNAEVSVGGRRVGLAPLERPVWVTPGRHQVTVRHDGYVPAVEDAEVAAGDIKTVVVKLRLLAESRMAPRSAPARPAPARTGVPPAAIQSSAAPSANRDESAPIYQRWWFWAGAGGAVALGVVAALIASSGGGTNVPNTPLGAQRAFSK